MTPGFYVQDGLAEGDETPGAVSYATFWSNCDEIINPDDSVRSRARRTSWRGAWNTTTSSATTRCPKGYGTSWAEPAESGHAH
ncbi:hypothetical protein ABT115_09465 [Streptomyces sp. NPDC001832]|uniref:hypothetical protein n=1 Tax=Streptomyces sp. NPDC001832 TaxID=3154527 RepID=UPI0033268189